MCTFRGRCHVWYNGKRVQLGKAGSEANRNYKRFINEITKEPSLAPPELVGNSIKAGGTLIAELCDCFLKDAKEAKRPNDYSNYKTAAEALLRYSDITTAEFDAYLLLQIQRSFVEAGYARTHCNKLVNFCIHIFKWGEVRRLVPPGKSGQLKVIEPVRIHQFTPTLSFEFFRAKS